MLITFLFSALFNLLIIEILMHERLNYFNQANSPLGNDMQTLMWSLNVTKGPIPGSSQYSNNKLDFLQSMCFENQIPQSYYIVVIPIPGRWNTNCNLTVTDTINNIGKGMYIATLVANIILLTALFLSWLLGNYQYKCSMISEDSSVMSLVFTIFPYILSWICIFTLFSEMLSLSSGQDNVLPGANYYNKIHIIILLCSYIVFYLIFLSQIVYNLILNYRKSKDYETVD